MEFKRQHKRATVNLKAQYIKKDLPNLSKEITIQDISAGGLCFSGEDAVETQSIVIITLYLKDEDINIKLQGKIMWNRFDNSAGNYLNGLQFTVVDTDDFQSFLSFYCKQILNF